MHGNVITWCQERFKDYPAPKADERYEDKEDILSISPTAPRVHRGGAFSRPAVFARSALRLRFVPTLRDIMIGFRPARTFTP
jgi:formylglycine-generating enzyme required for sulfatase activity